jgi:hypothetical protein
MMTLAPKLTEILTFKYVLHPDVLLLFELEQCTAGVIDAFVGKKYQRRKPV